MNLHNSCMYGKHICNLGQFVIFQDLNFSDILFSRMGSCNFFLFQVLKFDLYLIISKLISFKEEHFGNIEYIILYQ